MKRTVAVVLSLLGLLLAAPAPAQAEFFPVINAHVAVMKDGTCSSGNLFGANAYSTSSTTVWIWGKSQFTATCTFTDIGVRPSRALVLTDFACLTYFGPATEATAVLTPQGRLTFTCKLVAQQV